jgi:hypothetical protein
MKSFLHILVFFFEHLNRVMLGVKETGVDKCNGCFCVSVVQCHIEGIQTTNNIKLFFSTYQNTVTSYNIKTFPCRLLYFLVMQGGDSYPRHRQSLEAKNHVSLSTTTIHQDRYRFMQLVQ